MSDLPSVWPGVPYPLGATFDGTGTNFALYSKHATGVTLIIFDSEDPSRQLASIELVANTDHVFHSYVPWVKPGALYGYRVSGPWDLGHGHRFNPAKLLVDPYAKAIAGKPDWAYPLAGQSMQAGVANPNTGDSAPGAPKSVVVDEAFDWEDDAPPGVIWRQAVIYEMHVKGFTARNPDIPPSLRGTYAGLAHPSAIAHLTSLGVTSVELLPVHEFAAESFLLDRKLTNYWGYNTLGFFAPEQTYSSAGVRGGQVTDFKRMVKALHAAGLEVLLDVVFNHTCEGNQLGPTLSLRGIDNASYYWLDPNDNSKYLDFCGCGNSLNLSHPQVVKLVTDSLRYWVTQMHVDGFRFDLASELARSGQGAFNADNHFFAAIRQDPVLSRVKLIAEPWDIGPDGYQLGNFSIDFSEWNDRFRTTSRRFWRGDEGQMKDLGFRMTGSSDFFKLSGRRPRSSVNYVTSHDGFTLRDVVSYQSKHNELNGEGNRDGANDNQSANWGVEGETNDSGILTVRDRIARNLMATLFLSIGTPMLTMGDEFLRTQRGNNNAYCQDNDISWLDWNLDDRAKRMLDFTRACIALRHTEPALERRQFFLGATLEDSRFRDLVWFHPSGRELSHDDWENPKLVTFAMLLGGDAIGAHSPFGAKIVGNTLLIYVNASPEPCEAKFPGKSWGQNWELALDTTLSFGSSMRGATDTIELPPRSIEVFRIKV